MLPDDPAVVLRAADIPALAEQIGHDIVTASGTTLLGADDKAGVAEIVAAAEYLMAHPEIAHGRDPRSASRRTKRSAAARTISTSAASAPRSPTRWTAAARGELEIESFSADAITVTFHGLQHASGLRARAGWSTRSSSRPTFIARLPQDMSPETTDGYEGYVHPYVLNASVERTTVRCSSATSSPPGCRRRRRCSSRWPREPSRAWPGARVEVAHRGVYRNMREVLDRHPRGRRARARGDPPAALEPWRTPIRGGTDGSRLSFMGLPTPNLFAGEHNFHSRLEWVSRQDMEKAVETIVEIARADAEPAA